VCVCVCVRECVCVCRKVLMCMYECACDGETNSKNRVSKSRGAIRVDKR
jgi:hypothetical protein